MNDPSSATPRRMLPFAATSCVPRVMLLHLLAATGFALSQEMARPQAGKDFSPLLLGSSKVRDGSAADAVGPAVMRASPGPWGALEYYPIYLEAPLHMVRHFKMPSGQPHWHFSAADEAKLAAKLTECGFTSSDVEQVLRSREDELKEGIATYLPPKALVMKLSGSQRATFYEFLSAVPGNDSQADPVLIVDQSPQEWFASSGMRKELLDIICNLTYPRGDILAFADLEIAIGAAKDQEEAMSVMRALTRCRAQMVRLLINKDSNIPALMKYWTTGANLRRKDIEPVLEAVAETRGADKLDLLHLLPPMARKYAMTYPDESLGENGIFPNCHWTCLNFYNLAEERHLLDPRLASSAVLERFEPIEPPYLYGDILFFMGADSGTAYHSCVYLADQLVYTKNGRSGISPWIISTIDDVKRFFLYRETGKIQGYRLRRTR